MPRPKQSSKKTPKSKGLGDQVENALKRTGMHKLAKAVLGDDCGCDERKALLNRRFPHIKNWDITKEQHQRFEHLKAGWGGSVTGLWRKQFYQLYNEVTNLKKNVSSCGSCVKRDYEFMNQIMLNCDSIN